MSDDLSEGFAAAVALHKALILAADDDATGTALCPERPATPQRWTPTFRLIPYQAVDPAGLGLGGTDSFHDIGDEALDRAIRQVVWVEGPVHVLVLADRLLTGAGVARLGSRIRGRIEGRLARLETAGELALCHAFIARPGQFVLPPYRDWRTAPGKTRQLDHVHDGELMLCLLHAVLAAEGIAVDDALNNGLHRIGFTRLTIHARQRLQAPLQALLDEGMLDNEDNRLHLGPEAFLRRIRSR